VIRYSRRVAKRYEEIEHGVNDRNDL